MALATNDLLLDGTVTNNPSTLYNLLIESVTKNILISGIVAPTITYPTAGASISTPVFAVTGTGSIGAHIYIAIDIIGQYAGQGVVDGSGNWSVTIGPLVSGPHTLYVYQTTGP